MTSSAKRFAEKNVPAERQLNNYIITEEKIMKKNLTEIVFVLDRSGSMSGLEKDTIGGFNSMLEKQKQENGEAVISTVLFDNTVEMLHDRLDIREVEKLTENDYYVRGCTALLDALGSSITHIEDVHRRMADTECPEKTIFIITTDGMENASKEYTYAAIKKLVSKKQERDGWEFLFLGANIDAISAGNDIGIKAGRSVNYKCDSMGTAVNFCALSNAVSKFRRCSSKMKEEALADWDAEIKADYKKRGGK